MTTRWVGAGAVGFRTSTQPEDEMGDNGTLKNRRPQLADSIQRLDEMIDGLATAIPGAVADSVREALGPALAGAIRDAVREAVREAVK